MAKNRGCFAVAATGAGSTGLCSESWVAAMCGAPARRSCRSSGWSSEIWVESRAYSERRMSAILGATGSNRSDMRPSVRAGSMDVCIWSSPASSAGFAASSCMSAGVAATCAATPKRRLSGRWWT